MSKKITHLYSRGDRDQGYWESVYRGPRVKPKNRMEDEDGEDTVFQRMKEEEKDEKKQEVFKHEEDEN